MDSIHGPGLGSFAASAILARRLIERGTRVVQVLHRGWDQHGNLPSDIRLQCRDTDQPIGALLTDLKQRGLLDDTMVVFGSEFGRTPLGENRGGNPDATGRDHHPFAFTMLAAGGGMVRRLETQGDTVVELGALGEPLLRSGVTPEADDIDGSDHGPFPTGPFKQGSSAMADNRVNKEYDRWTSFGVLS